MESGQSDDAAPMASAVTFRTAGRTFAPLLTARRTLRLHGARLRTSGRATAAVRETESFPVPKAALRDVPQDQLLRVLDVVGAAMAVLLLAPVLGLIALGVRLSSPGPILFRQTRFGRLGRPFTILKFRTMTCMEDGPQVRQACRDDPRVTPFGAVLRKLSLDELPQLFNVLGGSMSLVGPRPHPISLDWSFSRTLPVYGYRFAIRPGITGLAQVRGLRGEIFSDEQIRLRVLNDAVYVRRRSVLLYLQVLLATVALVFFQREAY